MRFIISLLILTLFINANDFANFIQIYNIELTYSILAIIVLLCVLLFILKRKKNKDDYLVISKTQLQNQNRYLFNLINKSLFNLEEKLPLTTDVQTIKCTLYEAKLYLNSTLPQSYKKEILFLSNFLDTINIQYQENNKIYKLNIIQSINYDGPIKFNKELLTNILYLVALLQFKEHNINNAIVHISLLPKSKELIIAVDNYLELSNMLEEVIKNNFHPIYLENSNTYKGIYLYSINSFVNQLNGKLKVEIEQNYYKIEIILPIDIEQKAIQKENGNLFANKKGLIYITDEDLAHQITKLFEKYKVATLTINPNKHKTLPDFSSFDFILLEHKQLEPITIDFLTTLKQYHNLKIAILASNNVQIPKIIDYTLTTPIIQSKVYTMLHTLFNGALKEKTPQTLPKKEKKQFKGTILIADDDFVDLNLLKTLLSSYNLTILTAKSGTEVLDILKQNNNINLIILDNQMPKLNAFETIKQIRKNKSFNHIPVVLYTSENIEDRINEIFALGFDTYLQKPIQKEKLLTILERYLHTSNKTKNTQNNISAYPKQETVSKKAPNQELIKNFLSIYANADKLIEKYYKENHLEQALKVIQELQNISKELQFNKLTLLLEDLKDNLLLDKLDSELLENFSILLKQYQEEAIKKLNQNEQ